MVEPTDDLDWLLADAPDDDDHADATPVTVITGFLGAGKTTLVNRVLAEPHGLRLAVLVNDFGSIDVDSELIVGVETGTVSLANGCVCCEIRDDLIGAVRTVLDRDGSLDGIVLEASGVAEPSGIARTFSSPEVRPLVRLDGIIAVVDAEQLPGQVEDPATRDLVYGQIGYSDLVILNKIDLADREGVGRVREFVHGRLPAVRIIEADHADVSLEVLIGMHSADRPLAEPLHDDGHRFTSWVYHRTAPVDLATFRRAVVALPRSVYRIKGFLRVGGDRERRYLVQAVGMRADVTAHTPWARDEPSTALVVIADADTVDREDVERRLDTALTEAPPGGADVTATVDLG